MTGIELTTTASRRSPGRIARMNTVTTPDRKASSVPITHPTAAS
jgi:hypothetical protein